MPYTWHAVDLRTGKRGPEVRVQQRGTVGRIIGAVTDSPLSVLCWDYERDKPVPDWRQSTQPGRVMLVLVDDDDRPVWGGVVLRRTTGPGEWVDLATATLEHYLDRRYSGSVNFVLSDQAFIAQQLIAKTVATAGVPFTYDRKDTGVLRDRTYLDEEDKTTFSLLTDLLNLQSGLEFTVDLEWTDTTNTVLRYVVRLASRLGRSLPIPTRFEHPGHLTSFSVMEDYTKDNGANDVLAVSSGEAGLRPQSQHMVDDAALAGGWVRYETRFTPSTSIIDTSTLDSYAFARLGRSRQGLTQISLVANLDNCPKLNSDWFLGDDITAAITAPAYPEYLDNDGIRRAGYLRTVRVVGWTIDLDARTLTPVVREY